MQCSHTPKDLAEFIGLVSGSVTLVATAYRSCQALLGALDGTKNAPKHVHTIRNDLNDFYQVLGTLQAMHDHESTAGIVQSATSENLSEVLENSLLFLKSISNVINGISYYGFSMKGKLWRRLRKAFKEKEVEELRRILTAHKITLNLVISIANLSVPGSNKGTSSKTLLTFLKIQSESCECYIFKRWVNVSAHIQELQEKLPAILRQIGDVNASQIPIAPVHAETDRAKVRVDHNYALRHYLDSTTSMVSDIMIEATPSMHVSSFQASNSALTPDYQTAATHASKQDDLALDPRRC